MIGAIAGDMIGSVHEGAGTKTKQFELFGADNRFTDDTVLTVAVADSLLNDVDLVDTLHDYFHRYPNAIYGGSFILWADQRRREPYHSWGNGAAMRVSPVAFAFDSMDEVLTHAERTASVTHNHPEGIRGAQATAAAIFLARTGSQRSTIKQFVEQTFGYDLSKSLDEIRVDYEFDVSCQGSVPQSIIAFLESTDYEDAIRNAVSLGGDADTMACIAGGIAQAYWGVPRAIQERAVSILDAPLREIVEAFEQRFSDRPVVTPQTREVINRQRGCLLGLAIGDALGAAVEFQMPGTFEPVEDFRAGGPHGLNAGEWTDDTSMALALGDSMVNSGWDLTDQAHRYVAWWENGDYSVNGRCFDIGCTTSAALAKFQQEGDARLSGSRLDRDSGNGSIMRLAPVPIRFWDLAPHDLERLASLAEASSLPTHASPQCRSSCRYLALVLAALIQGKDRDEVLAPSWASLQQLRAIEPLHPEVDEVAAGSFRRRQPPEICGSGYVVKSLEAALWAFHQATDFREAVLAAVNLGDDADTTGAVCGQLAGAYWGESGLPAAWLAKLARRDMIDGVLSGLVDRTT